MSVWILMDTTQPKSHCVIGAYKTEGAAAAVAMGLVSDDSIDPPYKATDFTITEYAVEG